MPELRTLVSKDCSFVVKRDYTGDVHIVVPADRVEIDTYGITIDKGALISVRVPFESVRGFIFDYLRRQIKAASDNELEALLVKVLKTDAE